MRSTMRFLSRLAKGVSYQFLSSLHQQDMQLSGRLIPKRVSKPYLFAVSYSTRNSRLSTASQSTPNSTHTEKSLAIHSKISKHKADIIPDSVSSGENWADIIIRHTQANRDHLTPEIELRLITQECPLWHQTTDQCPFHDPFWAFYWPGGQALTRFILDHPELVKGKTVLDVGSGCGASAIAACMSGASRVLANDIDPVAIHAININAALNGITLDTSSDNLINQAYLEDNQWDFVFLGDMFYDRDFTNMVADWLIGLIRKKKSRVFIGDPGRVYLRDHPMRENLIKLFEIDLPPNCIEENRGHSSGFVWEFVLF